MSDEELLDLAASFGDLTQVAQQVLRDEMKKRGMEPPSVAKQAERRTDRLWWAEFRPLQYGEQLPTRDGNRYDQSQNEIPHVLLCECETNKQMTELAEALARAGIQSWYQDVKYRPGATLDAARVLVRAEQLDDARAILLKPIPQNIIDQSKAPAEDFVVPACPQCGAPDPILESIEPANTWRCEICNAEWSDAVDEDSATKAGS
ncbi:MAG TPA: hypothetical protein VHX60_04230 [Acidobacteriaceae bacterium]|nr:hypothetical protein [Acidobacteriaceae bacterium]